MPMGGAITPPHPPSGYATDSVKYFVREEYFDHYLIFIYLILVPTVALIQCQNYNIIYYPNLSLLFSDVTKEKGLLGGFYIYIIFCICSFMPMKKGLRVCLTTLTQSTHF